MTSWEKIKRVFWGITSISLWIASFNFSVMGFNFEVQNMAWVAYTFGAVITSFELAFSSEIKSNKFNLTVFIVGILCYVYGILSNFIGIWSYQGHSNLNDIGSNLMSAFFVFILALVGEIGPEVLMVMALGVNNLNGEGDIFKNLISRLDGSSNSGGSGNSNSGGNRSNFNQGSGNPSNRTTNNSEREREVEREGSKSSTNNDRGTDLSPLPNLNSSPNRPQPTLSQPNNSNNAKKSSLNPRWSGESKK